ncbi:hypothetical protein NL676_024524 [Syzygium grande]|nr:hypothetical protein NL676_024524 [Syzygium grande]
MGAEGEEEKTETKPNPISEAQFLSWKRRKDAEASARKAEAARKRSEDIAAAASIIFCFPETLSLAIDGSNTVDSSRRVKVRRRAFCPVK